MSPLWLVDTIIGISLVIAIGAYVAVSLREGSFANILTPPALLTIPAFYLLPLVYVHIFQPDGSSYGYAYVYATLAVENVAFAYFFIRRSRSRLRLPFSFGYANFWAWSLACVILSAVVYLPVILQFPQYILDPRQIYVETRTGFGASSFTSCSLAYLGVILVLFSGRSLTQKGLVIAAAAVVLALHGSKGQVLEILFFVLFYVVYVKRKRFTLWSALMGAAGVSLVIIVMFAASMVLGGSSLEAIQTMSEYSDFTRNDLLVIDSHFPVQYGRLTLESNTITLIPRVLMPSKPKSFGVFVLAEEFFPARFDADTGAPAFAIGVEYADFGWLAIVYLGVYAAIKGWLARVSVDRLAVTRHPADLILVAFMADVTLFPVGSSGWFLPETLLVVVLIRYISCLGADKVCRERIRAKTPDASSHALPSTEKPEEAC
jgi:hypothetical protein